MNINRYKKISSKLQDFKDIGLNTQIPTITKSQYQRGYIVRSFVQKSNDTSSHIFEVSNESIIKYNSNPFYISVTLDWRLTGDPIEIKKSNTASLRIASETIPKISLYLPNLLQFYKK